LFLLFLIFIKFIGISSGSLKNIGNGNILFMGSVFMLSLKNTVY